MLQGVEDLFEFREMVEKAAPEDAQAQPNCRFLFVGKGKIDGD